MVRVGYILLIVILLCLTAAGSTVDEYSFRISNAKKIVDQTLNQMPSGTGWEDGFSKEVLKALPASQKIEWPGGSVETDNAWLADSLTELTKTNKAVEKRAILTSISERLEALQATVKELTSTVAASQSKDQDKQRLAEILRRVEYQKAEPPEESFFHRMWREFLEWLENAFPSAPKMPAASSGLGGMKVGLQILVFVAVLGLIGFLIYKFAPGVLGRFGGKARESRSDRVVLGEHIRADESSGDLFAEAERLAREGDLRGAIRKGYIAVLCELGDRKVVRLAHNKTNRDYLRDVRKHSGLYGNMTGLTGSFEKSWYGQTRAETADWEQFKTGYRNAVDSARGIA